MKVLEMNFTWNGQISSFNGRCRVARSFANQWLRSCLILRLTTKIHVDKFKNT
jgi:hypothetical protein